MHTNPPKPTPPTPRSSTNPSTHHVIDTTLKAARVCSQHASPLISTCLQHELRLLERLYYKSANQHRAALFWRRVQEVRRLGKRVLEARLVCLLDEFRYSFYTISEGTVGGAERNPKILRGAWTQVPNERFLNYIHDRLADFTELLTSAKERLTKAFHTLSLTMQTGAFLHLTLILTAIVSRLHAVVDELNTILRPFLTSLDTLLGEEALGFKRRIKSKAPGMLKKVSSAAKTEMLQQKTGRTRDPTNATDEMLPGEGEHREDLGTTVLRKTPAYFRAERQDDDDEPLRPVSTREEEESRELPDPYASSSVIITTPITTHTTTTANTEEGTASRTGISHPRLSPGPGPAQKPGTHVAVKSKSKTSKETKASKKKKKRRRDEIDEIFGSL